MNFYGITLEKLEKWFSDNNENPFKASIVFDGIYRKNFENFLELGFSDRVTEKLNGNFVLEIPEIAGCTEGENTAKLLLRMKDGEYAETVLMRQKYGDSLCVSTQVGCSMGCAFCRSGLLKKRRSLTPEEITGQLIAVQKKFGVKISGVSVMGIGEPFDNFDNVMDFCDIISAPKGLGIGRRHITVSTCGIVPRMREYAMRTPRYRLALSLHAPNDKLRSQIMPVNKRYPVAEIIDAASFFAEKNNQRVALEYIMLEGINDGYSHAAELAELIGDNNFYVNLIPYNFAGLEQFVSSSDKTVEEFRSTLKQFGISVTLRKKFGAEVNAACGQLSADFAR